MFCVTTYKGNVRTDKIQPKWELVGTHEIKICIKSLKMGIS